MSALSVISRRLPRRGRRTGQPDVLPTEEHLSELRTRLLIAICSVIPAFVLTFSYREFLIAQLNRPLGDVQPTTLSIAEPFMTSLKVSFVAALGIVMPILVWQAWSFIAPAVTHSRRKLIAVLTAVGTVLFAGGAMFGYFIALPSAVAFLTGFDASLYETQIRANDYYIFAIAVLISIGLVFQLPLVLLGLVRMGLVKVQTLRSNRRYIYLGLTALAVALPGVDPVLTMLELVPLALLFEGSLLTARIMQRREDKQAPADTPA